MRNPGPAPLARIWLRLWDNGWSGCHPRHERVRVVGGGRAGALSVGCTGLAVDLVQPVPAGGRGTVDLDLPDGRPPAAAPLRALAQAGAPANAIPLLAVRDAQGWHLPPYTPEGMSFSAVAGSFRVTFDTPRGLDVASTGIVSSRRVLPGGRRRHPGQRLARPVHPEAPTVAHEIAHQWWYGVVGVDEYAAPWLNEGFASYGAVVYAQGACLLQDLARALGQRPSTRCCGAGTAENRFGNATTAGFQRLAEDVAGRDLRAFWKRHRLP